MTKEREHRNWRWALAAFLLVAVVSAIIAGNLYSHIKTNQHKLQVQQVKIEQAQSKVAQVEQLQRAALFSSCVRLNIVRASDNRSHYADWRFFTLTTRLLQAQLMHPPANQPTLSAAQKKVQQNFIDSLQRSANDKTWIPLTDCQRAVYNPTTFKIPQAVPFNRHLPSKEDLFLKTKALISGT